MSESESDPRTARREIIEEAQLRCYQARARWRRLRGEVGPESAADAADLQSAVLDYHSAVKPLSDDPNIKQRWHGADEDGVLWTQQVPDTDDHGRLRMTGTGNVVMVEKHVTLADLPDLVGRVERTVDRQSGFLGTRTETDVVERQLSPEQLVRAADLLDELVVDLGFSPSTPETLPSDEI